MDFHLNCWVPSLSSYTRIAELKNHQLYTLSKYILNEDHEGTSNCFDDILHENLMDKALMDQFTRFDRWFIFAFYRATNISPVVHIQTTTKDNVPCNVELQLFDLLTKISEVKLRFSHDITIEDLQLKIDAPKGLFARSYAQSVCSICIPPDNTITSQSLIQDILQNNTGLSSYIKKYLTNIDATYDIKLLENKNPDVLVHDVPLRLYDNTLYFFLRSIYLPFCKGVYSKQYNLMKKLGIDYSSIQLLTPLEGEIFINLHNEDQASSKTKKSVDPR